MKTPLGTDVDLDPGHIVLDGVPVLRKTGTAAPIFSARVYCGHGRPSQLLLSSCLFFFASNRIFISHENLSPTLACAEAVIYGIWSKLALGLWLRFVRGKSRELSSEGIVGVYVSCCCC